MTIPQRPAVVAILFEVELLMLGGSLIGSRASSDSCGLQLHEGEARRKQHIIQRFRI